MFAMQNLCFLKTSNIKVQEYCFSPLTFRLTIHLSTNVISSVATFGLCVQITCLNFMLYFLYVYFPETAELGYNKSYLGQTNFFR